MYTDPEAAAYAGTAPDSLAATGSLNRRRADLQSGSCSLLEGVLRGRNESPFFARIFVVDK
jgi:hypothetical protein